MNVRSAEQFLHEWDSGKTEFTLMSSGSTGEPKPFVLKRQWMEWSARNSIQAMGLQSADRFLCCIPADRAGGMMLLVRARILKAAVMFTDPVSDPMSGLPLDHGFTVVSLVPLQLEEILKTTESAEKLNSFRVILIGGAALSEKLEQKCQQLNPSVWLSYGMTETYSHIALRRINGDKPETHFRLLPEIEASTDASGCLKIKAPFTEGQWITTTDLAELLPEGNMKFLGRANNTINSGGVKLQAESIETAIAPAMPEGLTWFIGPGADERLGEQVTLYIEGKPFEPDMEHIRKLAASLHPYAVPRAVIFLPQFLFTDTGKIRRRETAALR